ncbi:MAG: diaminopimelate epimerase [Corynebacterium sp.]|uniref:diaminopimelate epimerase n=1 Tax=Corynebacterium sp. TaxID=1720 RepID=UPI0026DB09A3|nr:diaminopimelate epimerase [Corynebacterium sp.]MDO5098058.1 diaminopimelate epimerase [Corynebacterium sp.]
MNASSDHGTLPFLKGHGTENDFVIICDPDAHQELHPEFIAALCNRRSGIGGDGLLRVARTGALFDAGLITEIPAGVDRSDWFMDYYNADGSIAEMCGNGTRVFAHFVRSRGLVTTDSFTIGTRAGGKEATVFNCDDLTADVSVEMGEPVVTGISTCEIGDRSFAGLGVDMGNPHLACVVPDLTASDLADLELVQPVFDQEFFPAGVNVEILTALTTDTETPMCHMRVYERGVGETRSCGTGTVAAARAALADAGIDLGSVRVVVPGGEVLVTLTETGSQLRGPSKIIAEGVVSKTAVLP